MLRVGVSAVIDRRCKGPTGLAEHLEALTVQPRFQGQRMLDLEKDDLFKT